MKIILFLLSFLIVGALFIVSNNNLALSDKEDYGAFKTLYYDWVSHIFDNTRNLVGYVVKSEWLPAENVTG